MGETDVTTAECHAEIKKWECWKEAPGQLLCYNKCDPKNKLQVYLFGKYTKKEEAVEHMKDFGLEVFEFEVLEHGYRITCLSDITVPPVVKDWNHQQIGI